MKFKQLSAFLLHLFKFTIFIIGLTGFLFAGFTPIGHTVNQANTPIGYVTVLNKSNGLWLIGNADGQIFFTDRFIPGDTLEFQRIGYLPSTLVIPF